MKSIIMLYVLTAHFLLVNSCTTNAQPLTELLESLPTIEVPMSFEDGNYYEDTTVDVNNGVIPDLDLNEYQLISKINIDDNHPIIVIREPYNNALDFMIYLYSLDLSANVLDKLLVAYTADGEGAVFAINPESEIRIASYNISDAFIKTYDFVDGKFIEEPVVEGPLDPDTELPH